MAEKTGGRSEELFDGAMVVLCSWFVLGAYIDAWSRLVKFGTPNPIDPWQEAPLAAGWFLLVGLLLVRLVRNLLQGVPWPRALPSGYYISLVGCLVFGLAVIADIYWQRAFDFGLGLEALLAPTHLVQVMAGGIIVVGPLRAAIRRRERVAGLAALVSASLVLSVLTFATQFAHPLVDLWAADEARHEPVLWWAGQDLGVSALLIQSLLLVGVALVLLRQFELRPGSLTLVFGLNGALVAIMKSHYELLPGAVATGILADLLLWRLRPTSSVPRLRIFAASVPAAYTAFYLLGIGVTGGTIWKTPLLSGAVLLAAAAGWVLSYLPFPGGARRAEAPARDETRHPGRVVSQQQVKAALEALGDQVALAAGPLARLPAIAASGPEAGAEVKALLVEVVRDLASSRAPRDAEAGRVLDLCYLRRAGSHEQVAEQLHLSRPTFYRRLERGLDLAAERLDELAEFATREATRV